MSDGTTTGAKSLVVISAGVGQPSTTRMLADAIARATATTLEVGSSGVAMSVTVIELAPLAVDIAQAIVTGFPNERLRTEIERVAAADAVIAATPVYKAGPSGLFKSFIDILDDDLLVATPVVLAATAGTARHALVADQQLRPLFAYLRALTLPTSVFAAPEDWNSADLTERIERAATELAVVLRAGVGEEIARRGWERYPHEFAGNATRSARSAVDVDFDTPLMRLATGGAASEPAPDA